MRPMFSYMGSKWRASRLYGKPKTDLVIEPFAGSACYSLYWDAPKVILYDLNPFVAGIWEYLIRVSETEILRLPVDFDNLNDLKIPDEAKWLIGFWITKGSVHPNKSKSAWARKYRYSGDCKVWGEHARYRISRQVQNIRGWEVYCADYRNSPDVLADWFIDPPYEISGRHYPLASTIYREELIGFCLSRRGFVTVCASGEAEWLPFKHLADIRAMTIKGKCRVSSEVFFQVLNNEPDPAYRWEG